MEKMLVRLVYAIVVILSIPLMIFVALLAVGFMVYCRVVDDMTFKEWYEYMFDEEGKELFRELFKIYFVPIRTGEPYWPVQNKEEP